jgi:hypothetical protein
MTEDKIESEQEAETFTDDELSDEALDRAEGGWSHTGPMTHRP